MEKKLIFGSISQDFFVFLGSLRVPNLPSVRKVNCRKTNKRKKKWRKGTKKEPSNANTPLGQPSRPGADFSMSVWRVKKSIKIEPWTLKGRKSRHEPSPSSRFPASMALGPPRARSRIKRNEETRTQGTCDWVWHAVGPLARRIYFLTPEDREGGVESCHILQCFGFCFALHYLMETQTETKTTTKPKRNQNWRQAKGMLKAC